MFFFSSNIHLSHNFQLPLFYLLRSKCQEVGILLRGKESLPGPLITMHNHGNFFSLEYFNFLEINQMALHSIAILYSNTV